jgi:HK97 family phage prohead protease
MRKAAAPTREQKTFAFQVKEFDDAQGIVRGYLSTFNNVDEGGDRVRPKAFKRTLANKYEYKQKHGTKYLFPLLWQHDTGQPIGGYTEAKEDDTGLFVELQIDLDVQRGREAFSGLKKGYIFQQSMGYDTLQSEYVKVEGKMVRDLIEVRLWEGSIVTFPMNTSAIVTDVKSASGKTSWPLADRGTKWDAGQAKKDCEEWAGDDKGKLAQCCFWVAKSPPEILGDCKLFFVAKVDGEMKAIPQGIISAAGVLQGAMGGADIPSEDIPGIKKKIATYYKKMDMSPPWKDDGKGGEMNGQRKDFNATYQERLQSDWLDDLWNPWFALKSEIINAFRIGDQPLEDVQTALDQFSQAMLAYIQQGIDLGMVEALQPDEDDDAPSYGYMSNPDASGAETKEGRMLSTGNHAMLTKAVAGIMGHCDDMNKLLQSAKPQKSMGAAELPQPTKEEAPQDDSAVSTHLGELLASIQLANIGRQLKLK